MKKWIRRIIDFSYDSADQHISAFVGQSTFFIFVPVSILIASPIRPFLHMPYYTITRRLA